MAITTATAQIPLVTDAYRVIRADGTRVTLDTVVGAFQSGATAEEIVRQFPALALADVYQVIAYSLQHTSDVDSYLSSRLEEAKSLRQEVEKRFDPRGLRARLLERRDVRTG